MPHKEIAAMLGITGNVLGRNISGPRLSTKQGAIDNEERNTLNIMNEEDIFKEQLRSVFSDYAGSGALDGWERLEQSLDSLQRTRIVRPQLVYRFGCFYM